MAPRPLEPGDPVRLGRFELLARLGEGGQGIVYLGRGTEPGEEKVAIKVLRSSVDATVLKRLARELDAVHQVQPFVTAGIKEASMEGERRYIVSEYVDGPSLAERIRAGGPLADGELQRLAVGTATALTAIHGAGVVHRDFKPANVLLGPDGPRVVDFGIARLLDAATITSGVIGTPSFIAPERLAGQRPTSAVDIFAWAVTIGYAATGRTAFGDDDVVAVIQRILNEEPDLAGVPAPLRPVLTQCLAKDPRQRPAARDLLLRLVEPAAQPTQVFLPSQHAGIGQIPDQIPDPVPDPAPEPALARRRAGLIAAVAAVAVVFAVVLGVLLNRGSPSRPSGVASPPAAARDTGTAGAQVIPAAFAGTWAGTATMSELGGGGVSLESSISFVFKAGATTVSESEGDCDTTLTLTRAQPLTLAFREPDAGGCVPGNVTFDLQGTNLRYRWVGGADQGPAAQETGTLHRAGA